MHVYVLTVVADLSLQSEASSSGGYVALCNREEAKRNGQFLLSVFGLLLTQLSQYGRRRH